MSNPFSKILQESQKTEYFSETEILQNKNAHILRAGIRRIHSELAEWVRANLSRYQVGDLRKEEDEYVFSIRGKRRIRVLFRENQIDLLCEGERITPTSKIFGIQYNSEKEEATTVDVDLVTPKKALLRFVNQTKTKG